jgi:hypothetical protein
MESPLLDQLSQGNSILVFDCEFWHMFDKVEGVHYLPEKNYFFIPREVGGFMCKKTHGWEIKEQFFVTLDYPLEDVSLPISQFASVGLETAGLLDQIQDQIGIPWVDAHKSVLDAKQRTLLTKAIKLYKNDPHIKKHHEPYSWIKHFLTIYSQSTVIVKGTGDIQALKNICFLKNIPYKEPNGIVDIAEWNAKSKKICGSAKLEHTFHCIYPKLSPEIRQVLDQLPLGEAHNPVMDATMTLIVAMFSASAPKRRRV